MNSPWEEYRDIVRACKDRVRTAKAHLQLNLAKDVKGSKKGSYNHISSESKSKEKEGLLLNGGRQG